MSDERIQSKLEGRMTASRRSALYSPDKRLRAVFTVDECRHSPIKPVAFGAKASKVTFNNTHHASPRKRTPVGYFFAGQTMRINQTTSHSRHCIEQPVARDGNNRAHHALLRSRLLPFCKREP